MRCAGSADGLLWSFSALLSTVEARVREILIFAYPYPPLQNCKLKCPELALADTRLAALRAHSSEAGCMYLRFLLQTNTARARCRPWGGSRGLLPLASHRRVSYCTV